MVTRAEALLIAKEVLSGHSRSYVRAANILARFLMSSAEDGEGASSVHPADPSGSGSNADSAPPESDTRRVTAETGSGGAEALHTTIFYPPPPSEQHAPTCQCTMCLYGHLCKVCGVNYTTSEYCSRECASRRGE